MKDMTEKTDELTLKVASTKTLTDGTSKSLAKVKAESGSDEEYFQALKDLQDLKGALDAIEKDVSALREMHESAQKRQNGAQVQ